MIYNLVRLYSLPSIMYNINRKLHSLELILSWCPLHLMLCIQLKLSSNNKVDKLMHKYLRRFTDKYESIRSPKAYKAFK